MNPYKDIQAYKVGAILQITDWVTMLPLLSWIKRRTTKSLRLEYLGNRKTIEKDIRHGAVFLTNHRDIVMDAAWLSLLLRTRYNIRPYMGMGDNLFGKWWIEIAARFNRVFVVKRGLGAHELIEKSKLQSQYIMHLRQRRKSVWLAQREGRAKDSNDFTQQSVLKMLCMGSDKPFLQAIQDLNICPVSISYEYDPCDYLKAKELQQRRDNPRWHKRKADDILSMKTGILGQKGKVVFRLTPSINTEILQLIDQYPDIINHPINEQAQSVAEIIDRHIFLGYEDYERGDDFKDYIAQQVQKIDLPNKDIDFLTHQIEDMYNNPMRNKQRYL